MRRMNTFGRTGLVAAMENEEIVSPEAAEETLIEGGAESLETDLIEVQEEEAAASEHETLIEEAVETAEALESIAVAMEAAAQNGGLSKDAANVVSLALESVYKNVGLSAPTGFALESFGQTSSRVGATTIAMENIKEQIKKIWEKIVAAVKMAIDWLMDRVGKFFASAEKLKARAESLKEAAKNAKGTPSEASFEQQRLASALKLGGKVNAAEGLKAVNEMLPAVFAGDETIMQALEKAIEAGNYKEAVATLNSEKFNGIFKTKAITDPEAKGYGKPGPGLVVSRSQEMLGGVALITQMPPAAGKVSDIELMSLVAQSKLALGAFDPKAKDVGPALKVLSAAEMETIANEVIAMADAIKAFKDNVSKTNAARKKAIAAMEKRAKDMKDQDDKKDEIRSIQKLASALPRLTGSLPAQFSAYGLNSGKAACDYIEISLKKYGAEKPKAE